MRTTLLMLAFFLAQSFSKAQNTDSLYAIFNTKTLPDTARFDALHKYCNAFLFEDVEKSLKYGFIELKFAKDKKMLLREGRAYRLIARAYGNKFDSPNAMKYYLKGLKISEKINDYAGLGASYNALAGIYSSMDAKKAMDYRMKSISYAEQSGEKNLIAMCYLNTGGFLMMKDNQKSLAYKNKALNIYKALNDTKSVAFAYNQIGNTFLNMDQNDSALAYYVKSHQLSLSINDKNAYDGDYGSIGMAYNNLKKYEKALQYFDSAWVLIKNNKNKAWQQLSCLKDKEEAYAALKLYDKAYLVKVRSQAMEDSLFSEEKKKEVRELAQKFENEKKVFEEEKQKIKEAAAKRQQKMILTSSLIVLGSVLVFSFFLFRKYRETNKQKKIIELKNIETEKQKHLIEEKQKEIIDSIHYAKRIQKAIITNEKYIGKSLERLREKS